MKKLKQLFICLSAFVFCLGLSLSVATTAKAGAKDVPKKVHLYTGTSSSFGAVFDSEGSKITKLKSSSKNLKVKLTHQCQTDWTIAFYAAKKGSYKITFTIKPKKGKSINKTVTVTVDKTTPFKKITYGGKSVPLYSYLDNFKLITTATSGKLSITMNKGYKIKSITMYTYKQSKKNGVTTSVMQEKKIKNNTKISLGKSYYESSDDSYYGNFYSNYAEVAIEYTSAYGTETEYVVIYKI